MLEDLQTVWEKKSANPKYRLYKNALADGLAKLGKYYSQLDDKPSFILALGKTFDLNVQHELMYLLKSFIHIISSLTSNLRGVVQSSRPRKLKQEIRLQRIGMTRPAKFSTLL
jgi:hypothetical protein